MRNNNNGSTNTHHEETDNVFTFLPQFQSEMEDVPAEELEALALTDSDNAGEGEDPVFLENRRRVIESDGTERLQALNYFRRLVSENIDETIPRVIRAGLVPILVEYLQKDYEPALQLEAAWALTNISGGDSAAAHQVIAAGAIPIFVRLLAKENVELVDQVIWALGNLAGDSPTVRDTILAEGVVPLLIPIASRSWTGNFLGLQTYAWILTNFCGHEPLPDPHYVEPLLPVLKHLLNSNTDDQIVKDVCFSLTSLSDQGSDMVDAILQTGIASRLVSLLMGSSFVQIHAVIRLTGELLSGTERQTQQMIDAGVIPALVHITTTMNVPRRQEIIRREALWALSNITAGTEPQANAVFQALASHLPTIVRVITHNEDGLMRREALVMLSNAFSTASWSHIDQLINDYQFVQVLCDVLRLREMETLTIALEAVHGLLGRAEREGHLDRFSDLFGDNGGFEVLEELQTLPVADVYEGSVRIIEDFFAEDEGEDEGEEVEQ